MGAAFYNGLKAEPQVCECCAGNGGIKCFACQASGYMTTTQLDVVAASSASRDRLSRPSSKRECKACKGVGLILCSNCKGSGYK